MIEDITKAIDAAVVSCINDGILKDFLLAHRAEVVGMVLTEFDEKTFVEGIKQEGELKYLAKQICRKLRKGKTSSEIADILEEDKTIVDHICDLASKYAPNYDENKVYEAVLKNPL